VGTTAHKTELDSWPPCFLNHGRLFVDHLGQLFVLPILNYSNLLLGQLANFLGLVPALLATVPAVLVNF
jgi:hypothetical protein